MHLSYTFSDSYTSFRIKDSAKSGLRHGQSAIATAEKLVAGAFVYSLSVHSSSFATR